MDDSLSLFDVFRIAFFRAIRVILRITTFLRCPMLFLDPTAFVYRLWSKLDQSQSSLQDGLRKSVTPFGECSLLVIIPFRDKWDLTKKALESLVRQDLSGFLITVALVDNSSTEETVNQVHAFVSKQGTLSRNLRWKVLNYKIPFNFSKLNNLAFRELGGEREFEHTLFINNDVELTNELTLQRFLGEVRSRGSALGAVGCTLLYPNGRVQHSFLAPGVVLVGAHPLKGTKYSPYYLWYRTTRRVPAVTGALMWVPSAMFSKVGGFDEQLPSAYQDLDLCLKLYDLGAECYSIGPLTAIHHETASRKKRPPFYESLEMYRRWGKKLTAHPLVPHELSRWSEYPSQSLGEPAFPWTWLYRGKKREGANKD